MLRLFPSVWGFLIFWPQYNDPTTTNSQQGGNKCRIFFQGKKRDIFHIKEVSLFCVPNSIFNPPQVQRNFFVLRTNQTIWPNLRTTWRKSPPLRAFRAPPIRRSVN